MKPLILDYAISRKGEYKTIYEYDNDLSLNVVKTKNGKIPFIDLSYENTKLLTKTKVKNETDDESYSLLELQTKTEVNQERDDELNTFLELSTKTLVKQERDDEDFINY